MMREGVALFSSGRCDPRMFVLTATLRVFRESGYRFRDQNTRHLIGGVFWDEPEVHFAGKRLARTAQIVWS